ncbi:hypothetical protein LBMAG21_17350 [Armatimonadota bacterium]|nr:hypothetical protein [Armatimonadota bacterium]GDX41443.1 hypothetical protein LBMAG21_17350 [Armatimonadota bacterium]
MKKTMRLLLCAALLLSVQSLMLGCNRSGGEKKDTPKDTQARKNKKGDD